MRQLSKIYILITCGLITACAMATSQNLAEQGGESYKIQLLKDCKLVSEQDMTALQVAAYQKLQHQEEKMHASEAPIQAIEEQMQAYTDKIEKWSALAVQETETSLHIDKQASEQLNKAAKEFEQFMAQHREKFDVLEDQGHQISLAAADFEQSMKSSTADVDYDQVHVVDTQKRDTGFHCYSQNNSL